MGTEGDRTMPMATDDHEPDAGMVDQAPYECRVQELQVVEIGAAGHLRQVDHGQIPGRDDDEIWPFRVKRDLEPGWAKRHLAVVDAAPEYAPAWPVTGVTAGNLGEQRVHRTPVLGGAGRGGRGGTRGQQVADGVGEGASIALTERRPLALAVIRKSDERVRASHVRRDSLQRCQHSVDALQGLQRLPPIRPGMVGHLVIVDEVAEHHGHAAGHLLGDEGDVEVTQQDVGQPPQRDVRATAPDAGENPVPALLAGLVHLFNHFADGEDQRSSESLWAGRERRVPAGTPSR